jgi:hypothetical protein
MTDSDFDGVATFRALLAAGMRSFCISVHILHIEATPHTTHPSGRASTSRECELAGITSNLTSDGSVAPYLVLIENILH